LIADGGNENQKDAKGSVKEPGKISGRELPPARLRGKRKKRYTASIHLPKGK
jgi:hypothetical protein